jgi:ABC-type bacteriocin/lantibiotic exporter with double-glycine peptidase domain
MQRLAIARCLYKESEIIVFDEPTSNLDKANIDNIIKLIKKLKRNRILILVSHDLSVLNIADKVINLDKKVL